MRSRYFTFALFGVALALGASNAFAQQAQKVRVVHNYISPITVVLKEQGFLEKELAGRNVQVEWVTALSSGKAFEFLRGNSVDFASSGGSAALTARANGNPVKVVSFVQRSGDLIQLATLPDSGIKTPADLKGKKVAAARGTEPHYFLLKALEAYGLTEKDIQLVPLIHPDGRLALENGNVVAWAGLDPDLARVELGRGAIRFYRNPDILTGSVLIAREQFVKENPELTDAVIRAHEDARKWIIAHPQETIDLVAAGAKLPPEVAKLAFSRLDFTQPEITQKDYERIGSYGDLLKKVGDIPQSTDVKAVLDQVLDPVPFKRATAPKS